MAANAWRYLIPALGAILAGCASQGGDSSAMRGRMSDELRASDTPLAVMSLRLDNFQQPHFGPVLATPPTEPGQRYFLLTRYRGQTIAASAMAVCRARSEGYLLKSFKRGTAVGAQMSTELMSMPAVPTGPAELHVIGSTMPILLGAVGGLVVGITGSASDDAQGTVLINLADFRFEYDTAGRLHTMEIRTGAGNSARTQVITYGYDGAAQLPSDVQPKPLPELLPENIQIENCL